MSGTIEVRLAPQLGRLLERSARAGLVLEEGTWEDVVGQLRERCPSLSERILTASGSIAGGFVLVVNDVVVRRPEPSLPLRSGDEIFVIAALAGG